MKAIEEIYPDDNTYFGDYQPLIESFGHKISIQVDDDDYQGDTRLLLNDGNRYGLLIFGWGSCSGCDSLQACGSFAEVDELRQQLVDDIHWEPDDKAMRVWLKNKDWELEYSWHMNKTREFVDECLLYLEQQTA